MGGDRQFRDALEKAQADLHRAGARIRELEAERSESEKRAAKLADQLQIAHRETASALEEAQRVVRVVKGQQNAESLKAVNVEPQVLDDLIAALGRKLARVVRRLR